MYIPLLVLGLTGFFATSTWIAPAQAADSAADTVLHAADAAKTLPTSVFYRGQTAPVQSRNSGGVHYGDGMLVLVTNVDNSGYSSGVQQKFQSYLLTEVPLDIDGKHLPAGSYGLGVVSGEIFVTDIGAHDVMKAKASNDANLKRPTPLQVMADKDANHYRIYFGRDYFVFSRAK